MSGAQRLFREWVLKDWTALVGRLTYKPGVTLEVRAVYDGTPAVVFRISQMVPDVTGREPEDIQVMLQEDLPPVCCQREAMEFIRHIIEVVEKHEIDEWFRLDGKHFTEPHPENKRAA